MVHCQRAKIWLASALSLLWVNSVLAQDVTTPKALERRATATTSASRQTNSHGDPITDYYGRTRITNSEGYFIATDYYGDGVTADRSGYLYQTDGDGNPLLTKYVTNTNGIRVRVSQTSSTFRTTTRRSTSTTTTATTTSAVTTGCWVLQDGRQSCGPPPATSVPHVPEATFKTERLTETGLSPQTKIGLGFGIPLGALAVIAVICVGVLFWRRRRARNAIARDAPTGGEGMAEYTGPSIPTNPPAVFVSEYGRNSVRPAAIDGQDWTGPPPHNEKSGGSSKYRSTQGVTEYYGGFGGKM